MTIIFLSGCGHKADKVPTTLPGLPANLNLGNSSTAEVESELGQPEKIYSVEDSEMYNYKDNRTFKFQDNVMKAFFRDPIKNEVHLQFWLQKWKDQETSNDAIAESKNPHGQMDYQMTSKIDKTTIIYDKENGLVKRVMYYEK